jgi:hypothetical protein
LAINDFLLFATGAYGGGTPYVIDQPTYLASPELNAGFAAGIAQAPHLNKVWRQGTFVAHGVSQFISDALNIDVHDDGNAAAWVANFKQALNVWISGATGNAQPKAPPGGPWAGTNGTWQQASQAVLMSDLVGHYVPMAGMASTNPMTGSLYLNADPPGGVNAAANNMAATKHYVDSVAGTAVGGNFLPLIGGTLHNPGAGNLLMLQVDNSTTQNFILFNDTTTGQWNCGVNAGNQFSINYGAVTAATGYFMCDASLGTVNIQHGDLNLNAQTSYQYITRPNNPAYNNLAIAQSGGGLLANLVLNANITTFGNSILISGWVIGPNYGSDPLKVWANAGNHARVLYNIPNVREWSCGETSNGHFAIGDETGQVQRFDIDQSGNMTLVDNVTITNSLAVNGSLTVNGSALISGVVNLNNTGIGTSNLTATTVTANTSLTVAGVTNMNNTGIGTSNFTATGNGQFNGTVNMAGSTTINSTGIGTNNISCTNLSSTNLNADNFGPSTAQNVSVWNGMIINPRSGQTDALLVNGGIEVTNIAQFDNNIHVNGQVNGDGNFNCGAQLYTLGNVIIQNNQALYLRGGREWWVENLAGDNHFEVYDHTGNWCNFELWPNGGDAIFYLANGYSLTVHGNIWYNGQLVNGSDRRYKRNIESFVPGLAAVTQLKPVSWDWDQDFVWTPGPDHFHGGLPTGRQVGLIADEVAEVVPEMAGESNELYGHKMQTVNTTMLIHVMLNAIKELAAKVETLEGAA